MRDIHLGLFNTPRRALLWISLLCIGGALMLTISVNAHLGIANVETSSYATLPIVTVSSAPRQAGPVSGCWVTGDMVGDANPATIAASLCGSQ